MAKTYVTKNGYQKLLDELNRLLTVENRQALEMLQEAREKGDLSENSEYDAAKEKYENVNNRIQQLTELLSNSTVINEETVSADNVQILTTVYLKNLKVNKEFKYTIVPHIETNIKGTLNILQAAKSNEVKRILVTSTSEVYGTAQFVPITE